MTLSKTGAGPQNHSTNQSLYVAKVYVNKFETPVDSFTVPFLFCASGKSHSQAGYLLTVSVVLILNFT